MGDEPRYTQEGIDRADAIAAKLIKSLVREMPRYRCHKEVRALKIDRAFANPDGTVSLLIADAGFAPVNVERSVVHRYFPQPGDYLVQYDDGYRSISPRKAFEDGYTRIPE